MIMAHIRRCLTCQLLIILIAVAVGVAAGHVFILVVKG